MQRRTSWVFLACLSSWLLCACAGLGSRADDHTIARTTAEGELAGRPTLGMPIGIPGHETCLIPFSIETRKWLFQDTDPYSRGGFDSGPRSPGADAWYLGRPPAAPGGSVRWHNAIVRALASGEQWTILSQRGVIGHWRILGKDPRPDEPFHSEAIVFIATVADTNQDGLLDDLDAAVAIVAGGDGRDPRTVTPPEAQVWGISYDHEDSRLYLQVVADTNGDGEYTSEDEPMPFVLDVRKREAAAPVVSEDMLRRVEALLK